MKSLQDLCEEAHAQFERYRDYEEILTPSIPVLYFGDLNAYSASDLKVVTVGSNPSYREFREERETVPENPMWRFSDIGSPGEYSVNEYRSALNSYFEGDTEYYNWFKRYNYLLEGIGTSYYGSPDTALHTDLHSPLATSTRWSELDDGLKEELTQEGVGLWHDLIRALQPDLILASLKGDHLDDIRFSRVGEEADRVIRLEEKDDGTPRENPYDVTAWQVRLDGGSATVVYGRKGILPFFDVGEDQAEKVGQAIRKYLFN